MESDAIVIDSAEDFWATVERCISADKEKPGQDLNFNFLFEGWPKLHINVKGDKFHSSLTSSMVAGLASMHESLQRAYCLAKYETQNLQRLTNEDKQALDIIFQISEGSTDSETDWSATINQFLAFFVSAFDGMSGIQKMVVLLALITALTAGGCYYLHEQSISEQTKSSAITENTGIVVNGMSKAFQLGTEAKSRGETPVSREIENHGEEGKGALLKSVAGDAEQVKVGVNTYTAADLGNYSERQSVDRERRESFDNFYIKGLARASGLNSTDLNLTVVRASNNEVFTIKVATDIARPEELSRLANAIVSGDLIRISYLEVIENGRVARGQFNLILDNEPPRIQPTPPPAP